MLMERLGDSEEELRKVALQVFVEIASRDPAVFTAKMIRAAEGRLRDKKVPS